MDQMSSKTRLLRDDDLRQLLVATTVATSRVCRRALSRCVAKSFAAKLQRSSYAGAAYRAYARSPCEGSAARTSVSTMSSEALPVPAVEASWMTSRMLSSSEAVNRIWR
jgi:hypothetical protein